MAFSVVSAPPKQKKNFFKSPGVCFAKIVPASALIFVANPGPA